MADERSEREKLRGKGFGKPLSREWWGNFWYYYSKAVFIGVCVIVVLAFTIYEQATKIRPDSIVDYVGNHNFGTEQLANMQNYIISLSSDANGDKKVEAVLSRNAVDLKKVETDQATSNQLEKVNLNLAVGDQVIYLMDRKCFNVYAGQTNRYFIDIRKLASEMNVPANKIVSSKGNVVGIDLTGSGMLKKCKINLKPSTQAEDNGIYMVIRKQRDSEKKGKAKAIYDNNIAIAKKIMATVEK